MGPSLNISADQTARDLDAWVGSGLTCLENGGMTHPIHIVSFLLAQDYNESYVVLTTLLLWRSMKRIIALSLSLSLFLSFFLFLSTR